MNYTISILTRLSFAAMILLGLSFLVLLGLLSIARDLFAQDHLELSAASERDSRDSDSIAPPLRRRLERR